MNDTPVTHRVGLYVRLGASGLMPEAAARRALRYHLARCPAEGLGALLLDDDPGVREAALLELGRRAP